MNWVVYMIECTDGSIYTGITSDIQRRWNEHQTVGSKYSKSHGVVKLIWQEVHADEVSAEKRETQIKKWTRAKKFALAAGNMELLKKLSRRRN